MRSPFPIALGVLCLLLPAADSIAATLVWDADPVTAGNQDGPGTWSLGPATWNAGTATWNNATPDLAVFGAGVGTAGTVTIGTAITTAGLTFNATGAGTYLLAGTGNGTLTFGVNATTIATAVNATLTVPLNAVAANIVTKTGNGTLTLAPTGNSTIGQIRNDSAATILLGGNATTTVTFPAGGQGGSIRNLPQTGTYNGTTPINGTLRVVGGIWNVAQLGTNNTNASLRGTLRVSGGELNVTTSGRFIGSSNSESVITVDGGTLRILADRFSPGSDGSSAGMGAATVNVSAGTLEVAATASPSTLGGGYSSNFTQSGGIVSFGLTGNATMKDLRIGGSVANVKSAYTLTGGTLRVAGAVLGTSSANATGGINNFNFQGGVLAAGTVTATNLGASSSLSNPVADSTAVGTLTQRGGTLAPGDAGTAGRTVITGNYSLGANATLAVDVAGPTQASGFQTGQYDYVTVSGTAQLAGNLTVQTLASYAPAANATFTILNATGGLSGNFANVAFGDTLPLADGVNGCVVLKSGNTVQLTQFHALQKPAITAQPQAASASAGGNSTFSVSADSLLPVTYQWRKNGVPIAGATTATLSLTNVQAADAGSYDVVLTNSDGVTTSAAVALTYVPLPPVITTAPEAQSAGYGQSVTFSVVATGLAPITYQWRKAGDPLPGETGATLTIPAMQAANAGSYDVVLTNLDGTVTSTAVSLAYTLQPPVVTSQPAAVTAVYGDAVSFSVNATGLAPITCQWRKDGTPIPGATDPTLNLPAVQAADAGSYDAVLTNLDGSVTSAAAALTYNAAPPVVVAPPQPVTVPAGGNATFTITATGGTPISYQWEKNGATIPGATAATLALTNVQPADAGGYRVVLSNYDGNATSASANLTCGVGFTKADNQTALDQAASWSPVGNPSAVDTVTWTGAYASATAPLGAGLAVEKLLVASPSLPVSLTPGTGPLTLVASLGTGLDLSASTQNLAISAPVVLGNPQTWVLGSGRSITINGVISDAGQNRALALAGTGSVSFGGNNTFGGPTTIATGTTLSLTANGTLSGNVSVGVSTGNATANFINNGTLLGALSIAAGSAPASPNANELPLVATGLAQLGGGSLTGPILNQGQITLSNTTAIRGLGPISGNGSLGGINDNNTFAGGKTLVFTDGSAFSYYKPANGANATLQVTGNGTVSFAYFGYNSAAGIAYTTTFDGGTWNLGKIGRNNTGAQFAGTAHLLNGAAVNVAAPGFEHGTWNVRHGSLTFNGTVAEGHASFNNGLSISVDSTAGGSGTFSANGLVLGLGAANSAAENNALIVGNGGTALIGTANLVIGTSTNQTAPEANTVLLQPGGRLVVRGTLQTPSTGGANQTRAFVWTGGTLAAAILSPGAGFNGSNSSLTATTLVQTAGTLAPGDLGTAGRTVLTGNYSLGANALLAIDIGGATQASGFQTGQYDYLSVSGSAVIAGNLSVQLIGGYTPPANATFTLLNAPGGLSGNFSNVAFGRTLPLPDGINGFVVTKSGNTIQLGQFHALQKPVITAPPQAASASAGGSATFNVTATSALPLSYQWRRNGADLPGATAATLALTNVQAADAGSYDVVVTNADGSTTSDAAALTYVPQPPSITTAPASTSSAYGGSVTFSVSATGPGTLTYQWRRNGVDLAGATSPTLTVGNVRWAETGRYDVVVTNFDGSTISPAADLTYDAQPPSITTQPLAATRSHGGSVTFTVAAAGVSPLFYQWRKDGVPLAGATFAALELSDLQVADAGNYDVIVTNVDGTATSSVAALTYTTQIPVLTSQPAPVSASVGGNATFSVAATGLNPLSYQWRRNGVDLPGATAATLALANIQPADAGSYDVVVSNADGSVTSASAALSYTAQPPVITGQPAPQSASAGDSVTFSVAATGAMPITYQWRKAGSALPGATGASFTVGNMTSADAGSYDVVLTNVDGTVTSEAAALDYVTRPPVVTVPPASQGVPAGGNATFRVTATGAAPITYQWRRNGTALPGATAATLTLTNVQAANAGSYDVVLVNADGNATSAAATLTCGVAAPFVKANNTTTLDQAASWTPTGLPAALDVVSWNGTYANANVGLGAGLSVWRLQIQSPSAAVGITTGSGSLTLGAGGIDMASASQSLTVNAPVLLTAAQPWNVASGRTLTINATVLATGPDAGLTLAGAGSVVLAGNATFTGPTTLSAGTLHLGPSTGGTTGALVGPFTLTGGTLRSNRTDAHTPLVGPLTATGGTLQVNAATGSFTLNATNLPAGSTNTITTVTGTAGASFIVQGAVGANLTFGSSLTGLNLVVREGSVLFTTNGGSSNFRIEGGSFTSNATDRFQLATANQTLTVTGGSVDLTRSAQFGLRLGGSGSASQSGAQNVTANQTGGSVRATTLNLGGTDTSATKNPSYLLAGGAFTLTNNGTGALQLGADAAGNGTATFTLAGGRLVVPGNITGMQSGAKQVFAFTGGTLVTANVTATNLRDQPLSANGTLVQSGGTLAPGDIGFAGRTGITGGYVLGANATLAVDLAGSVPATSFQNGSYDVVAVTGNVTLAGNLTIALPPGYTPGPASTYTILTAGNISGNFSNQSGGYVNTTDGQGKMLVTNTGTALVLGGYTLIVPPSAPPAITTQPVASSVDQNGTTTLSVNATGTGLSYQWQLNGVDIVGATNPTLTVTGQPQSTGQYQVVVSNSAGSVTSDKAPLSTNLTWTDPLAFRFTMDQTPSLGANITDATGRVNGQIFGGVAPASIAGATAYAGSAWDFTGANGYLRANANPTLQSIGDLSKGTGLTISFWVNSTFKAANQVIAQLGNTISIVTSQTVGAHADDIEVILGSSGALVNHMVALPSKPYGSPTYAGGNFTFMDGTWHHFVVTFDYGSSSGNIKFYVDGAQLTPAYPWLPVTDLPFTGSFHSPTGALSIGASTTGGSSLSGNAGNTKLDQLAVFNAVLTPAEVAQLYKTEGIANYAPRVLPMIDNPQVLFPVGASSVNATLKGSAADDGLPSGNLTVTWSKVSGPGTVTFSNPATLNPVATFSAPGSYVLALTASDGSLSNSARLKVNVVQNAAPTVYASIKGAPSASVLTTAGSVDLSGAAEDDRITGGNVTYSWTQLSGPGSAGFSAANSANTTVTLPATPGTYVFQLTAGDGQLSNSTTVSVTVAANLPPTITSTFAATPMILWSANATATLNAAATPALAGNPVTYQWSQLKGPGNASFTNAASANTTATFSAPGLYQLQLAATAGNLTSTRTTWINALERSPGFTPPTGKRVLPLQPGPFVHPKLFFTDEQRPEFYARAMTDPIASSGYQAVLSNLNATVYNASHPYGQAYNQMKAGNTAYNIMAVVNDEQRYPILGTTGSGYWGMLGTACYVAWLNQDTAKLRELATVIANSARSQLRDGPTYRWCGNSLAFCYDVAFNAMSEDQRVVTRALMLSITTGATMKQAGWPDYILNNNQIISMNGDQYLWAYMVMEGETSRLDAAAYLANMNNFQIFLKSWGFSEKGWGIEGYNYGQGGLMVAAQVALAYRGKEDLFDTSRLYNCLLALFYEMEPGATGDPAALALQLSHFDTDSGWYEFLFHPFILKYLYPNDPLADWVYRNTLRHSGANVGPLLRAMFGTAPLPGNPNWQSVASAKGISLSVLDPQRGIGIARSDWSTDGLRLDFDCRSMPSGHSHGDAGNWNLYGAGRPWVAEGGYGVAPNEVHSTVMIDGKGSSPSAYLGGTIQPARFIDWSDNGLYVLGAGDPSFAYNYNTITPTRAFNSGWTKRKLTYPGWQPPTPIQDPSNNADFDAALMVDGNATTPTLFNGVQRAFRSTLLVRGDTATGSRPYTIIVDDIQKDAAARTYSWVVNTTNNNLSGYGYPYGNDMALLSATNTEALMYHAADGNGTASQQPLCLVRVLQGNGTASPIWLDKTPVPNSPNDSRTNNVTRLRIDRASVVAPNFKVLLYPHKAGEALPVTSWNAAGDTLTVSVPNTLGGNVTDTVTFASNADGRTRINVVRTSTGSAPAAPAGLTVTPGNGQATLSWNATAAATGYQVKLAATAGGPYGVIQTLGNVTTTTAVNLSGNATAYFVVSALNAAGEGPNSAERSALILPVTAALAAPAAVTPTVTGNQVGLTWNAVAGAWGYNVAFNSNAIGSTAPVSQDFNLNATTWTSSALQPNVVYTLAVSAVNVRGKGSETTLSLVLTDPISGAALQPPRAFWATAGLRQHTLSWTASSGATSYNVQRSTTSGGPYTTVASNVVGTTFTDTLLADATTYYYVVTAVSASGESPDSNQLSAKTLASTAVTAIPAVPTGVAARAGNAQAQVTWNFVPGATGYNVKRSTTSGSGYTTVGANVTTTSYTNTGLTNNTTYYYVVSARNGLGESGNSTQVSARPSTTVAIPPVPRGLAATVGVASGQVNLAWTAAYTATNYRVYRASASGGTYTNVSGNITATTFNDTGRPNGVACYYVVTAANTAGESAVSTEVLAFPTVPLASPGTPAGLQASVTSPTSVQLTWGAAPAANGTTRYNLKRATTSGGPYTTVSANNAATSFLNTGLAAGTTYYYVVTALNNNPVTPESAASAPVAITLPPAAPAGVTVTPGAGQVGVSWSSVAGATGYSVYRASSPGGPFTLLAGGLTGTSYTDLSYTENQTFYYYVVATTNGGQSNFGSTSANATTQTIPAPTLGLPTSRTVEATGPGGAVVPYAPTAADYFGVALTPAVNPPGGSLLALGNTTVTVQATDAYGKSASGSFFVNVVDTTAPALTLPGNRTVAATSPAGAVVSFPASAADLVGGARSVTAQPASGATFPIGTTTVNATASDAAGNSATGSFTVTVTAPDLPPPWSLQAVGNVSGGIPGTAGCFRATGQFRLTDGNGDLASGANDAFTYVCQPWTGDGVLTARIASLTAADPQAKVGLMVRENLTAGARHAFIGLSAEGNASFQTKTTPGGNLTVTTTPAAAPTWIRLVRSAGVFTAFRSADGLNWTPLGSSVPGAFAGPGGYAGLVLAAGTPGTTATAVIDQVTFETYPAPPSGFTATPGTGLVSLAWNPVPTATGYHVKRATAADGLYALLAGGWLGTSYADTGLTAGSTFFYVVTATNAVGEGNPSVVLAAGPSGALAAWRQTYFGTSINAGNAADDADPDGDGLPNLFEYAIGTIPTSANGTNPVVQSVANNHLRITFPRRADPAITYIVEATNSLATGNWSPIWSSTGVANQPGNVTVTDTVDITTQPSRYLRLRVTSP